MKEVDLKSIEELRNQYIQVIYLLQTKEDLEEILPMPSYYSFFPLMDSIINKLKEDVNAIEEACNLNNSDDKYELDLLKIKLNMCVIRKNEGLKLIKENTNTNNKKKKFIFAKTDSGNVYLEKDIKDIPEEYYARIISTLEKIESNMLENNVEKAVQARSVNEKLINLHYIKEFKIRTYYRMLSDDIVYVMMTRIKKDDNSKLDREEPIVRKNQTEKEFNKYKKILNDEEKINEILLEHEQIKNRILEQLNSKKRGVK